MEIIGWNILRRKIALKKAFKHAAKNRVENDTIFLAIHSDKNTGFGEALPREYVTGERIDDVKKNLERYLKDIPKKFNSLDEIAKFLDYCEPENSKNMASICAIDMALIDLYGKENNCPAFELLREYASINRVNEEIRVTSGPLGFEDGLLKKIFFISVGLSDIKLKIGPDTPPSRINKIGSLFLKPKTFRLDGNCSFSHDSLCSLLEKINVPVDYIEQPYKKEERLKPVFVNNKYYPIMADESVISLEDARKKEYDALNVRIGKNGGLLRSLKVIKECEKRNKPYILGSLVGETDLLSAALINLAKISSPYIIEGCYSSNILLNKITDKDILIRFGGKVDFSFSRGLGVELLIKKVIY